MSKGMERGAIARHLSAADERFALLLLLVRASWAPLRRLDPGAAEAFNRIDAAQPGLTRACALRHRRLAAVRSLLVSRRSSP